MNGINRLFLIAVAFVVALGAALGVLLYVSVLPFFHQIGIAATVLIITGIGCTLLLMVSFTYSRIGILLSNRRRAKLHERLIVHGDMAFWVPPTGIKASDIYDASARHVAAGVPRMLPAPKDEPMLEPDEETIIGIYNGGTIGMKELAQKLGTTYYQVQKTVSDARKRGLISRTTD